MDKKIKTGIVGTGARASFFFRDVLSLKEEVEIVAIADSDEKNMQVYSDWVYEKCGYRPKQYKDYEKMYNEAGIDVVMIFSSWIEHVDATVKAMEKGIIAGCEVGGAYDVYDCWKLVDTYERTKTPVMLLENCCFGRLELLALNMKRLGLFGKVVHCTGSYSHDLRSELADGVFNRHYRLKEVLYRNADTYPTHDFGPISKILDINRGNRIVSLVSMSSCAMGLKEYAKNYSKPDKYSENRILSFSGMEKDEIHREKERTGILENETVKQGDYFNTLIKCANGETIQLTLDTTLPRYYSRNFSVHGTKGMLYEENKSVFLESDHTEKDGSEWEKHFGNVEEYYKKYDHPIWRNKTSGKGLLMGGHGGMDALMLDCFLDCIKNKTEFPIDVYDMATWMSITCLSEQSVFLGSAPQVVPDFTRGRWMHRKNTFLL